MDYKIKKLPKSQVEITVTVPEEKMPEFRKKACEEISKEIKVPGFRPGHVPANILENFVDKDHLEAHTAEVAVRFSYADAVVKEKIQVVSKAEIKIIKEKPLTFTAVVAVLPEVEVKDYKSIKVPLKKVEVTKKDIDDVLGDMKRYGTTYKDVERVAKKGDRVEVDFEGFDEKDKAVENTKSQNHPVIIGEESLIPGFEDELIGLKKAEKKEFHITFPKNYGKKDFQNKKMKFKVEMKMIQEPVVPELTEEFIHKMTGQKLSVEAFKKDIEKNILAKKDQQAHQERENKYLEELLKHTSAEIPEALIDEEVDFMLQELKEDIASKGFEFGKFLEQAKTTEEDLRKKYIPEAEKRIKIRLALRYLIEKEKIEVKDDETKKEFEKIKANYPKQEQENIQKAFDEGHLKTQIINRLAIQKLFAVLL